MYWLFLELAFRCNSSCIHSKWSVSHMWTQTVKMEEGLELLEPTDLYNILQQSTCFSNLSDPNYLLLIGEANWCFKHLRKLKKYCIKGRQFNLHIQD